MLERIAISFACHEPTNSQTCRQHFLVRDMARPNHVMHEFTKPASIFFGFLFRFSVRMQVEDGSAQPSREIAADSP